MIKLKYIYKLTEAKKAKDQGGFFNNLFVKLVRKRLYKAIEYTSESDTPDEHLEWFKNEISKL